MSEVPTTTPETRHVAPPEAMAAVPEITPPPTEIEESAPALLGLRIFITAARLAATRETREKRESSHKVIAATSKDVRLLRGFRSSPENPDDAPITRVQRIVALHRESQAKRSEAKRRERFRSQQAIGKPRPKTPIVASSRATSDAPSGLEKSPRTVSATRNQYRTSAFDISNERMPSSMRRAIRRAGRRDERHVGYIARQDDRLDRAGAGETVPSKIRQQLISRAKLKEQRLSKKLEELRQIRPEAKRINTLKRQERHARRHEM